MSETRQTRLLRLPDIIGSKKRGIPARIPISKTAWWAGVKRGDFPAGIKLSPCVTVWRESDIDALINGVGAADSADTVDGRKAA